MSDAVTVAVITAVTQTIALIISQVFNRRSRRKSNKAIQEKLDAIALAHDAKLEACNDVVTALTKQVTRLQKGDALDDVRR